ncbi:MAG: 30S ribosome-binding factor RbfA [Candidatus Omnitrophota bacterium]
MSRMDKLNQQFKREIGTLLLLGEIRDPRVAFVTVTFADISRDLSYAHIGYSVLSDDPQVLRAAQEGLDSASGRVRKLVGERIGVRHIPEIRFVYDDSISQAVRMARTLDVIKQERVERLTTEGVDDGKEDH